MKLLILGGGNNQINAILRAKQKGHTVIVTDYYEHAPGKSYSDYGELVSTFDVKENKKVAMNYDIDGIMTLGTDQPVYTAAKVAESLQIPAFIDINTAKAVTNKKIMKETFLCHQIPTVDFALISKGFCDSELKGINFPVVIKPLDSQGQRGIYKLNSIEEIRENIDDTLSYSRENEILIEEYYENDEITVSGWVENGEITILTVTDRVTFSNNQHIGICYAHDFPSKHLYDYYNEIESLTAQIVKAFKINNGPIYFQMLIGKEGIKVNEIACRIGGAYEDELIPYLTGVDILDMVIDYSLGKDVDYSDLRNYNLLKNKNKASVQLFFAKSGQVAELCNVHDLKKLPGVLQAKFNFKPGNEIQEIVNATTRAGYMIICENENQTLSKNINRAFKHLKILDAHGKNLVIQFKTY